MGAYQKRFVSTNKDMNKYAIKAFLAFLVFCITFCSACEKPNTFICKTQFQTYAEAHAIPLTISEVADAECVAATKCADGIALLTNTSNGYFVSIFGLEGNSIGSSIPVEFAEEVHICDFREKSTGTFQILFSVSYTDENFQGKCRDLYMKEFSKDGIGALDKTILSQDFGVDVPKAKINSRGDTLVSWGSTIRRYSVSGELSFEDTLDYPQGIYDINDVFFLNTGAGFLALEEFSQKFSAVEGVFFEDSNLQICGCDDGVFGYNSTGIFACSEVTKKTEPVLEWNHTDLSKAGSMLKVYILSSDLFLFEQQGEDGNNIFSIIRPGEKAIKSDRTIVTVAGLGINNVRYFQDVKNIINSNEELPFEIEIIDYLEYTNGDFDDAMDQMNLAILTDNAADIYIYHSNEFADSAQEDFLDLRDTITSDASFSTSGYNWQVIEALNKDTELTKICTNFYLDGYYAPSSIIGDRTTWTPEEFNEIEKTLPEGFTMLNEGGRQSTYLACILAASYKEFIEPTSGTLSMQNEEFYELLDFSAKYAGYRDNSDVPTITDQACMRMFNISHFSDYSALMSQSQENTMIQLPYINEGRLSAKVNYLFSVSTNSDNIDMSWEFLKLMLSDPMQQAYIDDTESGYNGIPLNLTTLNRQYDTYLNPDLSSGEEPGDPKLVENFETLLANTNNVVIRDTSVMAIVQEEAPAYFLGEKSAEELAAVLENRIGLLLAERGE